MCLNKFILKCYQDWIDTSIPKDEIASNCTLWARVMRQAFPELILVGGYVCACDPGSLFISVFAYNYHEYLITENGEIVDPTATQFDTFIGHGEWYYDRYEEHLII